MEPVHLALDPAWAAGVVLSTTRVAAFAMASPIFARSIGPPGVLATVLALGLFLAGPFEGSLTVAGLLGAGVVNAGIGFALGWLTGVLFNLFSVAGGLVDVVSGLAIAQVFDPTRGEQGSLFNRMFHFAGVALFMVLGGLELLVQGLALSVDVVPLDGSVAPAPALLDIAVGHTRLIMVAGAELAMPVMGALFLLEVVLGVASRFAPQANVFLLGLPAKLFVALSMASLAILLFPEATAGVLGLVRDTFHDSLAALRG